MFLALLEFGMGAIFQDVSKHFTECNCIINNVRTKKENNNINVVIYKFWGKYS